MPTPPPTPTLSRRVANLPLTEAASDFRPTQTIVHNTLTHRTHSITSSSSLASSHNDRSALTLFALSLMALIEFSQASSGNNTFHLSDFNPNVVALITGIFACLALLVGIAAAIYCCYKRNSCSSFRAEGQSAEELLIQQSNPSNRRNYGATSQAEALEELTRMLRTTLLADALASEQTIDGRSSHLNRTINQAETTQEPSQTTNQNSNQVHITSPALIPETTDDYVDESENPDSLLHALPSENPFFSLEVPPPTDQNHLRRHQSRALIYNSLDSSNTFKPAIAVAELLDLPFSNEERAQSNEAVNTINSLWTNQSRRTNLSISSNTAHKNNAN